MNRTYKKAPQKNLRGRIRVIGLTLSLVGLFLMLYFLSPLISWQIYFAPVFASNAFTAPIPKASVLSSATIASLLRNTASSLIGTDYTNAQNWFPSYASQNISSSISSYTLSIPKIGVSESAVSTVDYNLKEHLINYGGTAIPPSKGTAVVFGHSTLPQLFNPKDYKTILANAHKLTTGDLIVVKVDNIEYTYKIYRAIIVEPEDTSVLAQDYSDSFLTLITCTPPGTTWKRLVIQSRLEKLVYGNG